MAAAFVGCQVSSDVPASALSVGMRAPDFSLRDGREKDKTVTLSQFAAQGEASGGARGGAVVIVFHRGLNCPACMEHLQGLADHTTEFQNAGVRLVAIGPDSLDGIRDAVDTYGPLPFPLLSDPDDRVSRSFKLETPEGIIQHGVFVIDRERRIRLVQTSDAPVGEASELISACKP